MLTNNGCLSTLLELQLAMQKNLDLRAMVVESELEFYKLVRLQDFNNKINVNSFLYFQ